MGLDYRVKCCPDGLVTDRRRRIRVLDCTIRDGGICNDWQFSDELVARTFQALTQAGVDYMEVGYLTREGLFDRGKVGPWRFCREDDLARVVSPGRMKLSAMVDIGRVEPQDIRPASESLLDVIRVATYAHQMDEALRLMDRAQEQGYETFMNVMAVSTLDPHEVDAFLKRLAVSGVDNVALVDSFGALYPYHVRYLVRKYMNYLGEGIKVGVHLHNNQQQAFANSIAAIDEGVDFVDATVHGMGRGAGNCPLELLLFYLDNPRYDVRPLLDLVDEFAGLRDALRWGYHLPYAITGFFNMHPRAGIERMDRPDRYECLDMYEKLARTKLGASEAS
ncbi:MAG: nucleoid-structuring protein H-NS [Alphaproteobacteria bacterium]|nr:nucleoid-structuring protein H-NS [Alphaproteobacteria bacterium]MCB9794485.1 nucleoid-structuring protein H-NS [Alphaproteobacteria bacterium]